MSQDWTMPCFIDRFDPFIMPGMKSPVTARSAPSRKVAARSAPGASALPPSGEDDAAMRDCLEGIGRRDEAALGRLYDLTVGRVYAVALRIMRHADLAEEVVSDVYMQVWRDAHRYDASRGRVLAWLLIISRSRALDLLRRQDEAFSHPDPHELVAEPDSGQKTAQDLLQASQEGSALHAAMATLTPLQRQLLSLAFFRGLSHSEIVAHCGLPLGTVKTHIRRALGALRDALGPAADSNG